MWDPEAITYEISDQRIGARTGDWLLLFVQFPGQKLEAAGVLLLDPTNNELYVRLADLGRPDEDIQEVWKFLSEDISEQSRQIGGEQVLRSFEQTWSNTFQIGERRKINIINPERTLSDLFERHIHVALGDTQLQQTVQSSKVKPQDLLVARKQLPRSPQIAGAALRAIRGDRPTYRVAGIIEEDPLLSAHLVRLGNSALYRHRGPEVRSVAGAIDMLGTNLVQRQIVGSCMGSLFSSMQLRDVWNHSVDIAAVSRQLSSFCKYPNSDELVMLGLVHDIGRLVFATMSNLMRDVEALQQSGGVPLLEAEKKVYGVSHPEVGGDLLTDWNFPTDMIEAVRNHHHPQRSKSILSSLLHLAESWVEGNEDEWQLSDHVYALTTSKLSSNVLRSLSISKDIELDALRFAA